ncbi:hypothetical protein SEA_UTZCHIPS_72 [Microbacterium phage UtzChips]|nr:hypothetical protein SEA_UTZCHIPS_72 [Microbacterium phage UtzChips]
MTLSAPTSRTLESYVSGSVRAFRHITHREAREALTEALSRSDRDEAIAALSASGFIPEGAQRMGIPLARVYGELHGIEWPALRRLELSHVRRLARTV